MRSISLALASVLIIASCGGGVPAATTPSSAPATAATAAPTIVPSRTPAAVLDVPAERSTLKVTMVPPAETDPAIPAAAAPHLVAFDPAATRRSQLFVFMAGNAILRTPRRGSTTARPTAGRAATCGSTCCEASACS